MRRFVPSQVVSFIDESLSELGLSVSKTLAGALTALLEMIRGIPEELITLDSRRYAGFLASVGHIRHALAVWESGRDDPLLTGPPGDDNPLAVIRDALSCCPDEFPSAATSELLFVDDEQLRQSIRLDIAAANQALHNGEWKAATVLAGAAVEALLLWRLQRCARETLTNAVERLFPNKKERPDPNLTSREWSLHHYIEVAAALGVITKDTADQNRLVRAFRNLIHPAKAMRSNSVCDRGTALSTVAAIEHTVRDLSRP